MLWVWRRLKDHLIPNLLPWAALDQAALSPRAGCSKKSGLEQFQEWGIHNILLLCVLYSWDSGLCVVSEKILPHSLSYSLMLQNSLTSSHKSSTCWHSSSTTSHLLHERTLSFPASGREATDIPYDIWSSGWVKSSALSGLATLTSAEEYALGHITTIPENVYAGYESG